jgi:hypothetical protein
VPFVCSVSAFTPTEDDAEAAMRKRPPGSSVAEAEVTIHNPVKSQTNSLWSWINIRGESHIREDGFGFITL